MRFHLPKHGQTRVIKRFAFFPIIHETTVYWLELLALHQMYDALGAKWETKYVRSIKLGERIN